MEAEPPGQAFGEAMRQLAELKAYAQFYLSSVIDRVKGSIRNLIVLAALGVLALVAVAAIIVVAITQVLTAIAGGFAQLFPSYPWLGSLITGLVVLVVLGVGSWLALGMLRRAAQAAIRAKYEALKQQQRQQFGRNVEDAARESEGSNA